MTNPTEADAIEPADGAAARIKATPDFLVMLIVVTALGPLAMSSFIPSVPDIQESFGVEIATAQLTITLSMVSMAVATLLYGPLSDRYGRRPVLLGALALAIVGSLVGATAQDISTAVIGRILQAAGGTSGLVLARAIVQDVYGRDNAVSMLGKITAAMVVAPMVGPTLGGVIADTVGWRGNFAFIAAVTSIVLIAAFFRLPETNQHRRSVLNMRSMAHDFAELAGCRAYMRYAAYGAVAQSAFFVLLTNGPFIMTQVFARPATEFGLYFSALPIGFMLGGLLTSRFGTSLGNDRLVYLGSAAALLGTGLATGLALAGMWFPLAVFAPMFFLTLGGGFSMPGAQAGSVGAAADDRAGAASGMFGFLQMVVASIMAQTVGLYQGADSPLPTLTAMLAIAVAAPLVFWALAERARR